MVHRGPDAAGIWIHSDKTVGLAHRRLSIIDLSEAGRQPLSAREGRIWITYNGETYNFQEIRRELEKKGYVFRSNTDTEVILNAYAEWDVDCLQKFNGMFAFGIYDEENNLFFLARDRVGKKPLYYTSTNGRFVFASELKALLIDGSVSREIDLQALNHYLTFGYVGDERCIFNSIRKLPAAHAMVYRVGNGGKSVWKYWEPPPPDGLLTSEEEMLEELQALLEDAVRLRMTSDVPLGAFLSGGIDSSLVVAMMSKVVGRPVKTFSIGFKESNYNELPYARVVAEYFNTHHHEIIVNPDAFSVIPELVQQFDEPFADSSMVPTYYVSRATREYVNVALSGDGGDELFGGYDSYVGTKVNYYVFNAIPTFIRKGFSELARFLPETTKVKRQLQRMRYSPYDSFIDRSSYLYFRDHRRRLLLNSDIIVSLDGTLLEPEIERRYFLTRYHYDFVNSLMYADLKTYLPDDILVKVDRASMLVSLEVRAPILDYRIVDFTFSKIPSSFKVRKTTKKYLLKKLAMKLLPRELHINRKWGFAMPIAEWFRDSLYDDLKDIILNEENHFFNRDYIERLLCEHQRAYADHSFRLFTLLIFSLWKRRYLSN